MGEAMVGARGLSVESVDDPQPQSPAGGEAVACERCGNSIAERQGAWIQDGDGRLRISAVGSEAFLTHARFWHVGCLYPGPYAAR